MSSNRDRLTVEETGRGESPVFTALFPNALETLVLSTLVVDVYLLIKRI